MFITKLKELQIKPNFYLYVARFISESKGYNAELLTFSENPLYKLSYRINNKIVNFGNSMFSDYIIYTIQSELYHLLTSEQVEEQRYRHLLRITNAYNWSDDIYSKEILMVRILWNADI